MDWCRLSQSLGMLEPLSHQTTACFQSLWEHGKLAYSPHAETTKKVFVQPPTFCVCLEETTSVTYPHIYCLEQNPQSFSDLVMDFGISLLSKSITSLVTPKSQPEKTCTSTAYMNASPRSGAFWIHELHYWRLLEFEVKPLLQNGFWLKEIADPVFNFRLLVIHVFKTFPFFLFWIC